VSQPYLFGEVLICVP